MRFKAGDPLSLTFEILSAFTAGEDPTGQISILCINNQEETDMTSIPRATPTVQMHRILESAVILSWKDLLRPSQRDLIQIEYVPGIHVSYLKIWQLTGKGEWSLVCEHWLSHRPAVATDDGTTFSNGYHSAGLAAMLHVIMQHQDHFASSLRPGGLSSTQVQAPTEQDTLAANACIRQAYESVGLVFTDVPAVAVA
jgi:hypothetical protein